MVIMDMLIDEQIGKYYSLGQENFCVFKPETLKQDLSLLKNVYGELLINILNDMLA